MILRIKCALMATRPKALTNLLFRESGCSRFLLAPQMPHALGLLSQFPSNSGLHLHYSPRKIHLSIFKDTKVYFYGEEVFFFRQEDEKW